MNLIKFIPFYINKIASYEFKENKNIFSFIVIAFICGLFLASKYLEIHNYIFPLKTLYLSFSILLILIILLLLSSYFNVWILKYFITSILFFIIGFMWFGFKAINNKTIFLQEELPNVLITGRITKVKEHPNSHLKSIYLTDLKYDNYLDDYLPKDVKLVTFYKVFLKKDDIISTIVNLQPIYALTPFENHLKTKSFWEKIGANGFVVGKFKFQKNISIKKTNIKEKIILYFQHIKDYFLHKINSYMSLKVVGVAEAITFGVNKNLTQIDRNNLQKSGLGPFIAISGLHIGIIATFVFILVRKLLALIPIISLNINSKKIAAIISIFIIGFYLLLLQDIPSALRAGAMAILLMGGIIFGIYTLSIKNLLLAVFLILLLKPNYISSTSFILSFTATAAVIGFLNSKIIMKIKNVKGNYFVALLKWVFITALLSLVISISLFPLIIHYFQVIPLYGILTNLVITPLFSIIIMPFLFLALILPAPLCVFFFKISDISISFMLKVASFVSSLDSSTIWFPQFSHYLVIIYVILFLFFIATVSRVKYLFLGLCIPVFICIFVNPLPNIVIDKNMKLLAFLDLNTKKYVLTSLQQARTIKNTWFKDSSKIHKKNIINSKVFYFNNNEYIINKNPYVLFNPTLKQIYICIDNSSMVIDKDFLQKNGSSFIYFIKHNIIKIKSNKTGLYVYDKNKKI